jgi:regulator of sigma E protease
MQTVIAAVIVLGVFIFIHELGHFLLAKACGVKVEAFSMGFPPKLVSKKIGDTDYRLSVVPLGGYVKLLGESPTEEVPPELQRYSFVHQSLWRRSLIVLAGPGFNLLFAILCLFIVFLVNGIPYLGTGIGGVKPDSPAARAGLQKGDQILSVAGHPTRRWEEIADLIRQSGAKPVILSVKRDDRNLEIQVVPQRMETEDAMGNKVSAMLIGINANEDPLVERVGPIRALVEGTAYSYRLVRVTLQSMAKLVSRQIPLKSLGGPIFIAQMAGQQASAGAIFLIHFMAVLSVNLAVLNLLPIPILDGGHLFFFLLEAILGKPVAVKHREIAQMVGMMMLLFLMVLVFYQDLHRLFTSSH